MAVSSWGATGGRGNAGAGCVYNVRSGGAAAVPVAPRQKMRRTWRVRVHTWCRRQREPTPTALFCRMLRTLVFADPACAVGRSSGSVKRICAPESCSWYSTSSAVYVGLIVVTATPGVCAMTARCQREGGTG